MLNYNIRQTAEYPLQLPGQKKLKLLIIIKKYKLLIFKMKLSVLNVVLLFRHDERLMAKSSGPVNAATPSPPADAPLPTQQIGVSLPFIKEHNNGEVIPPLVRQCVEYLSSPDGN